MPAFLCNLFSFVYFCLLKRFVYSCALSVSVRNTLQKYKILYFSQKKIVETRTHCASICAKWENPAKNLNEKITMWTKCFFMVLWLALYNPGEKSSSKEKEKPCLQNLLWNISNTQTNKMNEVGKFLGFAVRVTEGVLFL